MKLQIKVYLLSLIALITLISCSKSSSFLKKDMLSLRDPQPNQENSVSTDQENSVSTDQGNHLLIENTQSEKIEEDMETQRVDMSQGFQKSCGSFTLNRGTLTAICAPHGTTQRSVQNTLNLNAFITNTDGKLEIRTNFSASCNPCKISFEGVLTCSCLGSNGITRADTSLDLSQLISNNNGYLQLIPNQAGFQKSCGSFTINGGTLTGICAPHGTTERSVQNTLDLNKFITNTNGKLEIRTNFSASCNPCQISSLGLLQCTCKRRNGKDLLKTTLDLSRVIRNNNGYLQL